MDAIKARAYRHLYLVCNEGKMIGYGENRRLTMLKTCAGEIYVIGLLRDCRIKEIKKRNAGLLPNRRSITLYNITMLNRQPSSIYL